MESLASKAIEYQRKFPRIGGQFINDCHRFLLAEENWALIRYDFKLTVA
jgi:hypothetical protein